MTLNLNRTENDIDRIQRQRINQNWTMIENNFNNVVQVIGDKAFEEIVDTARLVWQEPVDTFADLATTYPNPEIGWAAWTREVVGGVSKAYRFNGTAWVLQQEFNGDAINEVDSRLSERIENNENTINHTGIDVLNPPAPQVAAKGDGVTDDTVALQNLVNTNRHIKVPTGKYIITDEIVIPPNRTVEFLGKNHWNPLQGRECWFLYDGVEALGKSILRVSTAPVGTEPTSASSNVKLIGGCLLDGNGKIAHGFYSAYATNESMFDGISVINCLTDGIRIEKSWYATYINLVARNNPGNGITIGKNGWGGVNDCRIVNLRAWGNGLRGDFNESNIEASYGVGLYLGGGCTVDRITSESNYAAGILYKMSSSGGARATNIYLERNGRGAKNDGKTSRNWGIIIVGHVAAQLNTIEHCYMVGNSSDATNAQSLWLTGPTPLSAMELKNFSSGYLIKADWSKYNLNERFYGDLSAYIEGHLPDAHTATLSSNITTMYVRAGGSDNNNGRTAATAFATIAKALNVAKVVKSVVTIDCQGITNTNEVLDFTGINKNITIDGKTTGRIEGTSPGNNGLKISNAIMPVTIKDFAKITRLNLTDCHLGIVSGCTLGQTDTSFAGTMEITRSKCNLISCSLSGANSGNETKNGIRLYSSNLGLRNTSLAGYSDRFFFSLNDFSEITSNEFLGVFNNVTFTDGSGRIMAEDKIKTSTGTYTL